MKKPCKKVTAVIPALLLMACVDNRNDLTGVATSSEESTTTSLPAPENLNASASDNEVNLSWDAVDGASAYSVYIYDQSGYSQSNYSPANLSTAEAMASVVVSTNSHLVSSLEYEVDYYFNVTALADDLESNQSNEVGVRPLQNVSNSTPYVQLLDDSANAADVVTLSAEASDPDGNSMSYLWQQTSGDSVDIADSDQPEAYFTAPIVDTPVELGFALTVFDNLGASSTSSATVTVSDNLTPQVDAGADQSVSSGVTVDLLGSASDADGSIVDIAWQQESGSVVSLSSSSTLDTSFTAPSGNSSELTLAFQLSVTDDRGASATDMVRITVAADEATTTIYRVDVAENSNGTIHVATTMDPEQESLTYSLSGTDADDFSIDSSSGAISFISTPDYEVPTDANTDNAYELTFAVSDGTTTTLQELVITVTDVDEAPTITSATDASTPENTSTAIYSASATNPENNPLSYSLSGTDAANFTINSSSGAISFNNIPDYENPADADANNVYALTLEVSDSIHTTSQALNITVTNIDEPPSIASAVSANILENTTTTIYTASASDPENDTLSYSLSAADAANFVIDPNSGAISFAINPDHENPTDADANNIYELTLEVSDSTHTTSQELSITVDDANDNAPIITAAQSFGIDENSATGTIIGTVIATDVDTSPTTYQDWTITSGDTNTAFAIDSSSGEITVADASQLDYEIAPISYNLSITVSDGVNTASAETLSINVNDVNEQPSFTSASSASTNENDSSFAYTATATDVDAADSLAYSISGGADAAAFTLNGVSLSFIATPNYESPTDSNEDNIYEVELKVTDAGGLSDYLDLQISVADLDEYDVSFSALSPDSNTSANAIAEDAAAGTAVGITASASDGDGSDSVSYSFANDLLTSGFFSIDASSGVVTLTNSNSLDYESATSHDIVVKATSTDGSTATSSTLSISVIDHDEFDVTTPTDSDSATNQIAENASSGTTVGITASASDGDDSDGVSYSFANDLLTSGFFSIDASSGVVTLTNSNSLDYETATSHDIVVKATSTDGSTATSSTLTISVIDHDEFDVTTPTDSDSATNQIAENASYGTTVGITATASDGDDSDSVSYSFANDLLTSGLFSIDASSGVVTLTNSNSLDYETATSHDIVVKATSTDGSTATSSTLSISVIDHDEFDVTTPIDSDSATNEIAENASSGTTVGITASASDADDSDSVSYSFANDLLTSAFFSIDASSGVVTLTNSNSLDYETATSHDIVVKATSTDGSMATSSTLSISVVDHDEFDVTTPTDSDSDTNQIAENASSGTTVGITASASDGDDSDSVSYSFANDLLTSGLFSIDANSGVVTLTNSNSLDYETATSHDIVVKATSTDGSTATSSTLSISVIDHDEFDVTTPIDSDSATNEIAENASSGTTVGITASASDADDSDSVSYSFANDLLTSAFFSIDASSGVVTLTNSNSLDYETATSHDIVVKATSTDGSTAISSTLTISVIDHDEFDVTTPTDSDSATNQIAENASSGTTVGITASASDADDSDSVSYSFANDLLTSGFFSIDAISGVITLTNSNSLDYETATSHDIVVKATSTDGSTATSSTLSINVIDHDEFDVATPTDSDSATNQIAENASSGTTVGITASASDADDSDTVSYSFANDLLTSGFFSIDASSGVVTLTNSNSLDYETATSHDIVVKATSTDGSTAISSTLTISVIDHDEFDVTTPTDSDSATNQIAENASSGTTVGITASASDADDSDSVSYSFANDLLTSGFFSIDAISGVITLTNSNSLDYETATSHDIVVKATSTDGSTATSSTLSINVIDHDEFDVATPTDSDSATNQIAENASSGTTVGITASASDADDSDTVSYSFANDLLTSGFFSIDASSGVVTLTNSNSLDYETATSHDIVVKATSTDGSTATSSTLSISVIDHNEFDVTTPTDSDSATNQIAENASSGTMVGITATASDADDSDSVSYSFANDSQISGFFSIDASSGVVNLTNSNSLDYETATSHDIVVKATSTDGSTATSSTLSIRVIDHDEFDVTTPTDSDSDTNQIAENASSGTTVGITASASDGDDSDSVSYSFANDLLTSGFFSIDASSGVVTLTNSNSLDYETAISHDIVVKATSTDGSRATSSTLTISVIDHDEFDVTTPTDSDSATNQIAENASSGTTVGITAFASDGDDSDSVSYSFANDLLTSGFFSIDASSGVVTLTNSNSLDYETATSHDIVVKATSTDGSTATSSTLSISVIDHDEFDVTTPTDSDNATNQIAEDASSGTTVGITASASDGDASDTVSYSFANDLLSSGFFSIDAGSGVVTLTNSNSLDYETATNHELVVKAASSDGSTATATFTINVTDVNEHDVVFATEPDADSSPNQISEDAAAGTAVGITASASDADGSDSISYSFDNDSQTSADNLFSIASDSGIVTLTNSNSLDYETATSHDIVIKATSSDGSSATETFTVNVTDLNDNAPVITASQSFDIGESSANGTSVGTVALSDADSAAVNTFTWSITAGNTNDAFAIAPSTGEITVNDNTQLDYSTTPTYTLTLTVSDGVNTSSAQTLEINVFGVAFTATYLDLPSNYIEITFNPEIGVSYQLTRTFADACSDSGCAGYKSFANPDGSAIADAMTFSQTHYYTLVGDNGTSYTTSISDDGTKLAALISQQSLTADYNTTDDSVDVIITESNNTVYTLYMADEPINACIANDSDLSNISSLCASGSSLSGGANINAATYGINWSARRYYRLDISDGYQVLHTIEADTSVIDSIVLDTSNTGSDANLTIDINWTALNSSSLSAYTFYLSPSSGATSATAANWSSLANSQIITGVSDASYSLVPILSQYYVAITATNTASETTPLSKVYLLNIIETGDAETSAWHEIRVDAEDTLDHWEGRNSHTSLVYDNKMWVIAGSTDSQSPIGDVWSSTDGYNWTEVAPSAAFGGRLEYVSMVNDDKMWVLGGATDSSSRSNDVWYSSNGADWYEATASALWSDRDDFIGASFDSDSDGANEMWLVGHPIGAAPNVEADDSYYSLNGADWLSSSVSGLPAVYKSHAVAWANKMWIVGGYQFNSSDGKWYNSNAVYSSGDGVNWDAVMVSSSEMLIERTYHQLLVYDEKIWVIGGLSANLGNASLDDYWYSSDGSNWYEVSPSGAKWSSRYTTASANYAGRMWVLGGVHKSADNRIHRLNDVWASGLEITSFSFNPTTIN